MPTRARLALLALGAAGLVASVLGVFMTRDARTRELAASAAALWVREHVDAHTRALDVAAARLAGLEARPPEVLERTLAGLAAGEPGFVRLWICDPRGHVLAAWAGGAQPASGDDPSAARREAMSKAPYRFARAAGLAGAGDRIELASAVRVGEGAPELYLAADLSTDALVRGLGGLDEAGGGSLSLVAGAGSAERVIYPRGATAPGADVVAPAGSDLTLGVRAGTRLPLALAVGGALVAAFALGRLAWYNRPLA
jgi:hypothetical protein